MSLARAERMDHIADAQYRQKVRTRVEGVWRAVQQVQTVVGWLYLLFVVLWLFEEPRLLTLGNFVAFVATWLVFSFALWLLVNVMLGLACLVADLWRTS